MKLKQHAAAGLLMLIVSVFVPAAPCTAANSDPRTLQNEAPAARRRDAAHEEAAAHLFCYYNGKLGRARAEEYARHVMDASKRYGIAPSLIAAMIVKESHAKANARSKYAVGLLQVYWRLHRQSIRKRFPHITTEKILMEPRNNIMVGTWLFSKYLADCGGSERKALQRYLGSSAGRYVSQVMQYRKRFTDRVNRTLQRHTKRSRP